MAIVTIFSDLEPKKIKSVTVSIGSPSICNDVMGPNVMILFKDEGTETQRETQLTDQ